MQIQLVRRRMAHLGLTEEVLAQHLRVSLHEVQGWLAQQAAPPAAKLTELSRMLALPEPELLGDESARCPYVHYHCDAAVPTAAAQAALDAAGTLQALFGASAHRKPLPVSVDTQGSLESRVLTTATLLRARLGVTPGKSMTLGQLSGLLRGQGVVIVPSPGKNRTGFPPAFSVECLRTPSAFLVVNLSDSWLPIARGMARAYAHFLASRSLAGGALEDFRRLLAMALVPLGPKDNRTGVEDVCGELAPPPSWYVVRCQEVFATPVFCWLARLQARHHDTLSMHVAQALCTDVGHGLSLSAVLADPACRAAAGIELGAACR